jgi:hypothetical protein
MNDRHPATSQGRVLKADKRARTLVLAAGAIGVFAVIVLAVWVIPWGHGYLQEQEPRVVLWVVEAVVAVIFLSVVPLAVYLYWLGRQVVRHRQLPPPGMKVIVDTRVIEGDPAVTRGRIVMALAVILLAVGLLGGLWLPYRLERAFAGRLKEAPAESGRRYEAAEQPSNDATP